MNGKRDGESCGQWRDPLWGVDSQIMLHASSPPSVILTQLHVTSFILINLRRVLHPQESAHAGRTKQRPEIRPFRYAASLCVVLDRAAISCLLCRSNFISDGDSIRDAFEVPSL